MLYTNQKAEKKELIRPITGIFSSLKNGLNGFFIVLALTLFTKLLSFFTSHINNISIELSDIIISFWGFLIFSFITFASQNKR